MSEGLNVDNTIVDVEERCVVNDKLNWQEERTARSSKSFH